ncbi:MAG: Ig-like domain-containing protein, partial [Mycobacterium sp.]
MMQAQRAIVVLCLVALLGVASPALALDPEVFATRCFVNAVVPSAVATITDRSDAPSPVCSTDHGPITNSLVDSVTETRSLLLRFEISQTESTIGRAWLRLPNAYANSSDALNVTADWYEWDACDAGDVGGAGTGTALDAAGSCGTDCSTGSIENGFDLQLDSVSGHVNLNGATELRVTLGGGAVVGSNAVTLVSAFPLDDIYLVYESCTDEIPVPPACEVLQFPAREEAVTFAEGVDEPPTPLVCTDDAGESTLVIATANESSGGSTIQQEINTFLNFDTSTLPTDQVPYLARVRMHVLRHQMVFLDTGTLEGDWYNWGPSCDLADHAASGATDALSAYHTHVCDYSCYVATLPVGADVDFPLANPLTRLNRVGTSGLRLRMSEAALTSYLFVANSDQVGNEPELLVLACDDPTPPPATPPTGCAYHVLPAPLESQIVAACTPENQPTLFQCGDSGLSASMPQLVAMDTYDVDGRNTVVNNLLLRWDTSTLPSGATIDGAWLRLFVPDRLTQPGAALTADWDPWGECDSDDVTRAPTAIALSTAGACGTACQVGSIAQAAYTDFPLDTPATHITRGVGARTDLRVRVVADAASGQSWLAASDSDTLLPGPGLIVLTCDAEPPPPAATDAIIAWGIVDGGITVTGRPGSFEGGAQVTITNVRTGQQITVTANADGSFTAPLDVEERDVLTILVTDAAGNPSPPASLQVLPPDPVLIAPPLDRTVATTVADSTAFLYTGPLAVQVGIDPETIEPARAAVMRGAVIDRNEVPLPGVRVTVLDHPEYGYTLSRSDGWFDLAVNGGGPLTIEYDAGVDAFPAQRTVTVPWQGYAQAPAVALVEPDADATVITLGAATTQLASGGPESDANGSREAVLLIPANTTASMIVDGTPVPAPILTVRLTEYTVGERGPSAMPGELPPASAYTYAVEVSADEAMAAGAERVELSQPLPLYVDNFLDFPVGQAVPLGSYDREQARWEPAPNGVVLQVVSVTAGVANLDTTGDGVPESDTVLATQFGITLAERQTLATRYAPGASLWRVALTFFSRWDCNWPGGPPSDAIPPNGGEPTGGLGRERLDDPDLGGGGELDIQNQALRQEASLPGTPYALTYRSDRQLETATLNPITIPLIGATVPTSLERVEVHIDVAGRRFIEVYRRSAGELVPGLTTTFAWDGVDVYGRLLQGRVLIDVETRFVYPRAYDQAAPTILSFSLVSGQPLTDIGNTRAEITTGRRFSGFIGGWDSKAEGLGGWSLDVHRSYDPVSGTLGGGDGSQRSRERVEASLTTAIGGGTTWPVVDNVTKATAVELIEPNGVAVAPDGTVYVADSNVSRRQILRLNADGTVYRVAGGGTLTGEGVDPRSARLLGPYGLAFGPDGALYVTEAEGARVRRIDLAAHTITTVAGTGIACPNANQSAACGDGGPALQAQLRNPSAVQVAADGRLYIADAGRRVRVVGPEGTIQKLAGEGPNCCGNNTVNGIPASQALFFNPEMDLALAADGSLYVATGFSLVRRIAPDGRIYTVAGDGTAPGPPTGDVGDGGLAIAAEVFDVDAVALVADGSLLVADRAYDRVRRVDPLGLISALAGTRVELNTTGFSGDGGAALAARFDEPSRLAPAPDGSLYIAVLGNKRVLRVRSPLPGFAALGDLVIASPDGSELYVFDNRGRHKLTVDALVRDDEGNPTIRHSFAYDAAGRLAGVTDVDGRLLDIQRPTPSTVVLTGPDGQATTLTLDTNGYAVSVASAAGATTFAPSSQGLITSATGPNNHTRSFSYGSGGRLSVATDPPGAGGSDTLTRTDLTVPDGTGYQVVHTTEDGVQTAYQVAFLPTGEERRTTLNPDGTQTETLIGLDGGRTVTQADGTVQTSTIGPDPRFGLQAPVTTSSSVSTPDGLTATLTASRTANVSNPTDPLSLTTQTDTLVVNNRPPA